MKRSSKGNFTVYEDSDPCALQDYSEVLGEELETKFENVEQEIEESAYDDRQIKADIEALQEENEALQAENTKLKQQQAQDRATYPTTTGSGENITLSNTAELEFIQPPLPRGNSEQVQYEGKNKLNVNETVTITNYYVDIPIELEAGTYTISLQSRTSNAQEDNGSLIQVKYEDNLYADFYPDNPSISNTHKSITNTTTQKIIGLRVFANRLYGTSANVTTNITGLMLESGSTATSYEPYCGGTASPNPSYPQAISNVTGDVEVLVQNKNLFDITSNFPISKNGLTFIKNDDGTITINGTASTTFSQSFTLLNQLLSGNYVIKHNAIRGSVSANCYMSIQDSDNNNISDRNYGGTGSGSISLENKTIVSASLYITSGTVFNNYTVGSQLEQGTTATTYTPHKEQTFTFPLGNQRMYLGDYLADDGIHHVRGTMVFNGSENWSNYTSEYDGRFYCSKHFGNEVGFLDPSKFKCTHFTPTNGTTVVNGIASTKYATYINATDIEGVTSPATLKTWLNTHNTTVEYELAEEKITPYTAEQQQAYDEIKQAISYEEQTNISGNSDESNPIFSVEAYQSTKLVLQEISNAVVALGGV